MTNEWKFFIPVVLALIALGAITLRLHQRIWSLERRLEARPAADARQGPPCAAVVRSTSAEREVVSQKKLLFVFKQWPLTSQQADGVAVGSNTAVPRRRPPH